MDIKEIYKHYLKYLDKEVEIVGWVRTHRKQKDIGFIKIYDGSCFKELQVVYECSKDLARIRTSSSVKVIGKIVLSTRKEQKIELVLKDIEVLGESLEDYPLQPKAHSREFLREQAYLRPRTQLFQAVFRIRSIASIAIHKFFSERDFIYLQAPIFTASDCEGAGEMFKVTTQDLSEIAKSGKVDYEKEFFGKEVGLSVSTQFEAETFAQAFKKVYTFGPTFRADHSKTPFHLAEFWQIEPEVAFCDLDGIMDLSEGLLKYLIRYVLRHAKDEMKYLDTYVEQGLIKKLRKVLKEKFQRVTYSECIKILQESGKTFEFKPVYGADISKEHEKYITAYFDKPVFITMWPKELKSFYMKLMPDGTVKGADLELPGVGEVFGMSQREEQYDVLLTRMQELKMKTQDYEWYLKLRKYGTCIRSGFGIGFERLLMYITGMDSIRDVIPYPRAHKYCEY